jgi:hypothetical protein
LERPLGTAQCVALVVGGAVVGGGGVGGGVVVGNADAGRVGGVECVAAFEWLIGGGVVTVGSPIGDWRTGPCDGRTARVCGEAALGDVETG